MSMLALLFDFTVQNSVIQPLQFAGVYGIVPKMFPAHPAGVVILHRVNAHAVRREFPPPMFSYTAAQKLKNGVRHFLYTSDKSGTCPSCIR
jgi:hypothetical protein